MRSEKLKFDFWPTMCERVFEGLDMTDLPKQLQFNTGTNTYFTNGIEDPWEWATVRSTEVKSDHTRTSDCTNCGHCVEMYTPVDTDPIEVQQTRDMIRSWTFGIFGPENWSYYKVQPEEFLQ